MLDIGLLLTGVLLWLTLAAAARWAPVSILDRTEVVDRLIAPSVLGLVTGRLVAVVLDDPASLRSLRSLLVIRSGVEFWPGVIVAVAALAWTLKRQRADVALAMAELAPFLLWGYATYEAACVVRDGCYGPVSAVGLVPDGLGTRMLPVGLVVALSLFALGLAIRHLWAWSPPAKVLLALGGVAAARSLASIWLPRLGDGLTRQHVESVVVLAATAAIAAIALVRARIRARRQPGDVAAAPTPTVGSPATSERS